MLRFSSSMQKLAVLISSVAAMSFIGFSSARADDGGLLQQIATNTYNTYVAVNNIPTYLGKVSQLALAFLDADDSKLTATIQEQLATYTKQSRDSIKALNAISKDAKTGAPPLQPQLISDLFGSDVNTTSVPNANDLIYQTFLGLKYFPTDPRSTGKNAATTINSPYNYIKNASGMNLYHAVPQPLSWKGSDGAKANYTSLYDTIMAVESFNAYALSEIYTDSMNNNALSKTQQILLTYASNSDWFSTIASEKIGYVIREILMYNSQMYVLMSQILTVQKQLLAAQSMTNTLLISLNSNNEDLAVKKAQGVVH